MGCANSLTEAGDTPGRQYRSFASSRRGAVHSVGEDDTAIDTTTNGRDDYTQVMLEQQALYDAELLASAATIAEKGGEKESGDEIAATLATIIEGRRGRGGDDEDSDMELDDDDDFTLHPRSKRLNYIKANRQFMIQDSPMQRQSSLTRSASTSVSIYPSFLHEQSRPIASPSSSSQGGRGGGEGRTFIRNQGGEELDASTSGQLPGSSLSSTIAFTGDLPFGGVDDEHHQLQHHHDDKSIATMGKGCTAEIKAIVLQQQQQQQQQPSVALPPAVDPQWVLVPMDEARIHSHRRSSMLHGEGGSITDTSDCPPFTSQLYPGSSTRSTTGMNHALLPRRPSVGLMPLEPTMLLSGSPGGGPKVSPLAHIAPLPSFGAPAGSGTKISNNSNVSPQTVSPNTLTTILSSDDERGLGLRTLFSPDAEDALQMDTPDRSLSGARSDVGLGAFISSSTGSAVGLGGVSMSFLASTSLHSFGNTSSSSPHHLIGGGSSQQLGPITVAPGGPFTTVEREYSNPLGEMSLIPTHHQLSKNNGTIGGARGQGDNNNSSQSTLILTSPKKVVTFVVDSPAAHSVMLQSHGVALAVPVVVKEEEQRRKESPARSSPHQSCNSSTAWNNPPTTITAAAAPQQQQQQPPSTLRRFKEKWSTLSASQVEPSSSQLEPSSQVEPFDGGRAGTGGVRRRSSSNRISPPPSSIDFSSRASTSSSTAASPEVSMTSRGGISEAESPERDIIIFGRRRSTKTVVKSEG